MARLAGTAGQVTVAAGEVTGIKSWSVDYVADALEGTGFDSSGNRVYTAGLKGWSGSFEGYKNGAPTAIGTEIALELKESATATQKHTGQAIITGFHASASVDGLVTYSYDFQGTGAFTVATT
jgi:predicted secreted protein